MPEWQDDDPDPHAWVFDWRVWVVIAIVALVACGGLYFEGR